MAEALLINLFDLKLKSENGYIQKSLLHVFDFADRHYGTSTQFVYLMCCQSLQCEKNETQEDIFTKAAKNFQILKNGFEVVRNSSMAAILYSVKRKLDERDISIVKMVLPQSAAPSMEVFIDQLLTAVYQFEFRFFEKMCEEDALHESAEGRSPLLNEQLQHITSNIQTFLGSLQSLKGDLNIIKSPMITDTIFLHGFTTRAGGISYIETLSSLNLFCSSKRKDPKAIVAENLRRLAKAAGFLPDTYHSVKVDHSNEVWVMGKTEPDRYDGIVTNRKGVTIAAPSADCIPLLFSDPIKKVCGVAHSGWKGTHLGVAMVTVNAMVEEFGSNVKDIVVVMGPSIGPCCFTLPQENAKAFHAIDPKCVRRFDLPNPYIDIRRATRVLLERGGILPHHIQDDTVADKSQNLTLCTSCYQEMFFSHARDGNNFGTQIGFISIKD